jgi:hypothetical protein
MCDKEYNGWTNWETWNTALWIGEVDGMGDAIYEQALKELEDATDDEGVDTVQAHWSLSKWLEGYTEEMFFGHIDRDELHGPASDAIFISYLPAVDFFQIAKHYIHDAQEGL